MEAYNQVLLGEKLGEKTLETKCLWFIAWTKKVAFISIHSRITTIAELTICAINWITHLISHLSKIKYKKHWERDRMMAEETGLEPARRCRRTVF